MWRAGLLRVAAAVLLAVAVAAPAFSTQALAEPVDLELVLAVDCSGSVDSDEFALQIRGYASALTHPSVLRAIQSGRIGAIGVTYVQWSGPSIQNQAVGWTVIKDASSARAFADAMLAARRQIFGGGTSLSGAVDYGRTLFGTGGLQSDRRTIDVSGDGINNRGRVPTAARDEAVADGITINGLPILTDFAMLDEYYKDNVVGGPGAFVIPAENFESFAAAILNKLVREIAEVPGKSPPFRRTSSREVRR